VGRPSWSNADLSVSVKFQNCDDRDASFKISNQSVLSPFQILACSRTFSSVSFECPSKSTTCAPRWKEAMHATSCIRTVTFDFRRLAHCTALAVNALASLPTPSLSSLQYRSIEHLTLTRSRYPFHQSSHVDFRAAQTEWPDATVQPRPNECLGGTGRHCDSVSPLLFPRHAPGSLGAHDARFLFVCHGHDLLRHAGARGRSHGSASGPALERRGAERKWRRRSRCRYTRSQQ